MTDSQYDQLCELLPRLPAERLARVIGDIDRESLGLLERAWADITRTGWRSNPLAMGVALGELRPYPHTAYLAGKFVQAVRGEDPLQIWNLPPQHGKSLIASRHGPAWALEDDPTTKIALTSYGDELAKDNSIAVRTIIRDHEELLTVRLRRDLRRADRFVTDEGGGLVAAGVGSALTGFGAHLIVVDDPFKNWQEAHSEARRLLVWNWYRSVVRTRLNRRPDGRPGAIVLVMCMAGDTAVLMGDGTEKPLRDVRPGDVVATYENGGVTTAVVRNWANQGPDKIYAVRTKAGRVVRANARHPFRVVGENGVESWVRLESLKAGMRVRSVRERTPTSFERQSTTWAVDTDQITEIVETGREDVYDIEVDRTHNFIANGLEVSNTRWHEDDLTGKLLEAAAREEGEQFTLVRLPALAEDDDDPLGRARGEALAPELHPKAELEALLVASGSYLAAGLYQQRPAPEEGTDIMRGWWKWYDQPPPRYDDTITSWDMKLKDKESGSFVVGQAWGRTGSDYWLIDQLRGQWNEATTRAAITLMQVRHPDIRRHVIENTGNGPEVLAALRTPSKGYTLSPDVRGALGMTDVEARRVEQAIRKGITGLVPEAPKGDKRVRARTYTPLVEAGHVHLPHAGFAEVFVDETAAFPNGAHDDQVDAWSQAMKRLSRSTGSVGRKPERRAGQPKPGASAKIDQPARRRQPSQRLRTIGRPRAR